MPTDCNDYYQIIKLVAAIDHHLIYQTRHFRTRAGQLLTELEEVIRAILADDLAPVKITGQE